jgi:hypothetical protein
MACPRQNLQQPAPALSKHYILNKSGKPRLEPDLWTWAIWFEKADRQVAETFAGDLWVSTVFLAIDHSWGNGPPILWETMVFDKAWNEKDIDRCSGSREQAEAMHAAMVKKFQCEHE